MFRQVLPQLILGGLTLEHQTVPSSPKPGAAPENANHGFRPQTGHKEHVKVPGQPPDTVAQMERQSLPDAEPPGILPGSGQRLLCHIRRQYSTGPAGLQQVNGQISVVRPHITDFGCSRYKIGYGF